MTYYLVIFNKLNELIIVANSPKTDFLILKGEKNLRKVVIVGWFLRQFETVINKIAS